MMMIISNLFCVFFYLFVIGFVIVLLRGFICVYSSLDQGSRCINPEERECVCVSVLLTMFILIVNEHVRACVTR